MAPFYIHACSGYDVAFPTLQYPNKYVCLHATGGRTLEEIRRCLSLHVEQLYRPYVYANKSKTNGTLSRDTGKRRDVEMLNIYWSRHKSKRASDALEGNRPEKSAGSSLNLQGGARCECGRGSDTRGEWKNERPLIRHNPQWEVVKSNYACLKEGMLCDHSTERETSL